MARLPRLHLDGSVYLVTARGDAAEPLFRAPADYDTYLSLVSDYATRRACRVFAYCLLPQQVQLCLETPSGEALSAFMHDVTAAYTRYANKRYTRHGHLFQARFHAVMAEKMRYLLSITAYLHAMPEHVGLVPQWSAYPFSSYGTFAGTQPPRAVASAAVEAMLAMSPEPRTPQSYADYVTSVANSQMLVLQQTFEQKIVGSEAFVDMAKAQRAHPKALDVDPAVPVEPEPVPAARGPRPVASSRAQHRAFPVGLAIVAGGALIVTLSLMSRVQHLTQMVRALAQENEAAFQARHAVSVQPTPDQMLSLDGTEWDLRIAPASGSRAEEMQRDRVAFLDRQFDSSRLAEQGFTRAWYAASTQAPGQIVWEVIQTNADGDIMAWNGESQGSFMKGVLTKQSVGGSASEVFTFVGIAVTESSDATRSEI